ncbi:MAG: hypothetical protein AAF713_09115 [Pseudomonadota bacterium]
MNHLQGIVGSAAFGAVVMGVLLLAVGAMPLWFFEWIFAISVGASLWGALSRFGVPSAAICSLGLTALALAARAIWPEVRLSPYLAICVINLGVAYVFSRGLQPGRTPLILQLIKLMGQAPDGSTAFRRFVRGQCWLWAGLGSLTGLLGLIAMTWSGSRGLLDPALTALVLLQLLWFVVSHIYARRRYHRPETWLCTLRVMARPKTWAVLEI